MFRRYKEAVSFEVLSAKTAVTANNKAVIVGMIMPWPFLLQYYTAYCILLIRATLRHDPNNVRLLQQNMKALVGCRGIHTAAEGNSVPFYCWALISSF